MKKQLEQMGTELREIMIYQSPPELGALWTEVNDMMDVMSKQQKTLIIKQIQQQEVIERRRQARIKKLKQEMLWVVGVVVVIIFYTLCLVWVVEMRKEDYPEYGQEFIPRLVTDHERVLAEKNAKYWDNKAEEYRRQQNNK